MNQASNNPNARCLYITNMHHMEQKIVFPSYVYDFVYWYTSEALVKWFVYTLGNIFPVNFLVFSNCFISIRIYQMKDHSISEDQAKYSTFVVDKHLDTDKVKTSTNFYKNTFPYDMIFIKDSLSNSYEQVYKLAREFNIHYRSCIGSLVCLLSKSVALSLQYTS